MPDVLLEVVPIQKKEEGLMEGHTVMMTAAVSNTSRVFFLNVDSAALKPIAPTVVDIAGARPFNPTLTIPSG